MRLTEAQIQAIRRLVHRFAGSKAQIWVFGSRLDDTMRGGDLDLMVEFTEPVENPAWLAAQLSARLSRLLYGRKVDVLLRAPNLKHMPIHDVAFRDGRKL